jgi:serine/threonine protein kinase
MTEWVGKTFSKVRIDRLVARGGMAEVYLGLHTTLNRPVAVKILHRHLEGETDLGSRFEREAQVLAGLRHPHIVQVYDFDIHEGQPFIVMEYVPGVSLSAYLQAVHSQGGRLTLNEIGHLLSMLVSALDYAHQQGVIHRDIKPANILLTSKTSLVQPGSPLPADVEAILTDFGLLRLAQSAAQTASGTVSGTPAYMSPEQARGDQVDYRSDLYSLGVTLYEMLAGKVPFEADTSMAVLLKHLQESPAPIEGLPASLQLVLDRALAKNPEERYASAKEFLLAFLDAGGLTLADVSNGLSLSDLNRPSGFDSRATLPVTPPTVSAAPARPRPALAWIFAGVALLGLLLAAAFLRPDSRSGETGLPPTPTLESAAPTLPAETPAAAAHQDMGETPLDEEDMDAMLGDEPSFGSLRFYNVAGLLDEVILSTWELPPLASNLQYEAWLVGEEIRRSLGVLPAPDGQGQAGLFFIDEQGRNLLARYNRIEITLEPNPDSNPNSSGRIVYSSGIPPLALEHLRHLFVSVPETPGEIGLLVGLESHVLMVHEHTELMLDAYQQEDPRAMRRHAEAVYNLLVGSQARGYGDLNNDGQVNDPGDGFGLLLNGEQVGYIEGTISHTGYAMSMDDAWLGIVLHGEHVIISSRNVEGWAVELADLVYQVATTGSLDNDTRALVLQSLAIADRMKNGRDLNGNERIEPISGEGGLLTVLEHAFYMLDMPLFEGAQRLPRPEPAQPGGEGHEEIPGYMP